MLNYKSLKTMREFTYITVGKILLELKKENILVSRATFYRLEKKLGFPTGEKSSGSWRVYTQNEVLQIKNSIKKNYKLENISFSSNTSSENNILDFITKLFELKNKGIVTKEEFEIKKKQLLGI